MVSSLLSLCLASDGILLWDFLTGNNISATQLCITSHLMWCSCTHILHIYILLPPHTHTRHHNTPGISDTTYITYYFWMKGSTYGIKDKIVTVISFKKPGNSHFFPDICVVFFSVKILCLCMNCMINECSSVVNYEITGNTDNKKSEYWRILLLFNILGLGYKALLSL